MLVAARRKSDNKVIASRVQTSTGNGDWTYALDFKYIEAPLLVDYQYLSNKEYYSLATKVPTGGFAITLLRINSSGLPETI